MTPQKLFHDALERVQLDPSVALPKALAAMQAAYAKLDSVAFVSEEGDTDDVKAALIDAMAALSAA
ncbi:hypothetical protein [Pseudomonas syringae]|uniref:hypothetical protein n=1 Tax=Pseudomonas syringae TaxID=317 RepID=UPI0013EEFE3B|nr:hypothetical protein [Pseudomonas syringae]